MNRRLLIKQLALGIGGTITLPAWSQSWNSGSLPEIKITVSPSSEALLAEIVNTIIPSTDTPGAKELGVHKFVITMISDCFDTKAQEEFSKGMEKLERDTTSASGIGFVESQPGKRLEILKKLEESSTSKDSFFVLIKELTINGYLNSEYVMTNILKYELIPGRFNGCFPVK